MSCALLLLLLVICWELRWCSAVRSYKEALSKQGKLQSITTSVEMDETINPRRGELICVRSVPLKNVSSGWVSVSWCIITTVPWLHVGVPSCPLGPASRRSSLPWCSSDSLLGLYTAVTGAAGAKAREGTGTPGCPLTSGCGVEHSGIRQSSSFSFGDWWFFSKRLNMGGK